MKLLVIAACLVNFGDDRGGVDVAVGEFIDAPKDTARFLAENERVLYTDKKDDHTKEARYTASDKMIAAAEAMAKQKTAKAAKAAEKPTTTETPPA